MNATGAVVFLPREGNGRPDAGGAPLRSRGLWLAESLRAAGSGAVFRGRTPTTRPGGGPASPPAPSLSPAAAATRWSSCRLFSTALEGKVIVITKPGALDWGDARTLAGLENGGVLDSKDTGVYRIDGGLLSPDSG